jgi:hypothetical protein
MIFFALEDTISLPSLEFVLQDRKGILDILYPHNPGNKVMFSSFANC